MTVATARTPEVSNNNQAPVEAMGKVERYGRIFGGYALGFLGVSATVSGLVSGNPAGVVVGAGIGLGMIYGSDRILRPIHAEWYGEIPESETRGRKVGRFATFAASLTVMSAGLGLINNAILPNSWTGADFNLGERVVSGGLGVLAYMGGRGLEKVSRRPGFINNQIETETPQTVTVAPRRRLRNIFRSEREPDEDITADLGAGLITAVREKRDKTRAAATRTYDNWTDKFPEPRRSELRQNFAQEVA